MDQEPMDQEQDILAEALNISYDENLSPEELASRILGPSFGQLTYIQLKSLLNFLPAYRYLSTCLVFNFYKFNPNCIQPSSCRLRGTPTRTTSEAHVSL
jgi:hypothetical protein